LFRRIIVFSSFFSFPFFLKIPYQFLIIWLRHCHAEIAVDKHAIS
jgi:hypothetical protein